MDALETGSVTNASASRGAPTTPRDRRRERAGLRAASPESPGLPAAGRRPDRGLRSARLPRRRQRTLAMPSPLAERQPLPTFRHQVPHRRGARSLWRRTTARSLRAAPRREPQQHSGPIPAGSPCVTTSRGRTARPRVRLPRPRRSSPCTPAAPASRSSINAAASPSTPATAGLKALQRSARPAAGGGAAPPP